MFFKNLKQVALASAPIVLIVLVVHFAVSPFENIGSFLIGYILLLFGETIFLVGVEESVVPMGEFVATGTKSKHRVLIVLLFGFIFGIFATLAEPDVHVLSGEISLFGIPFSRIFVVFTIGFGVGLFVAVGLFRGFAKIPILVILFTSYAIVFLISVFVPSSFVAMAFDAGSASTGIVTAPFLLALCAGIGESNSDPKTRENRFGLIGITSIGPVLSVLILFLISGGSATQTVAASTQNSNVFFDSLLSVTLAIVPVAAMFFIYEAIFLKLPKNRKLKILASTGVTFVGLFMMLFGLEYGFVAVGKQLGFLFGERNLSWLIVILGGVFGFLVTFTEPAVRVLASQVEEATNTNIKSQFVLISIAISMFVSVALTALCVLFSLNMAWVLCVCFAIALILMFFSRRTFVSIAFDSGGVALGPTSTAFIFPLILGLSSAVGGVETFGALGLIGVVPIIFLEIIGCVYAFQTRKVVEKGGRRVRAISGVDKFSNISDLEKFVIENYGGKS